MSAPRKGRPKAAPKPPTRLLDVVADVRDRLGWTDYVAQPDRALNAHCDAIAIELTETLAAGAPRLHFDESVACDFRERLLRIAAIAIVGVFDHDKRALAARPANPS